ncbi:hypothetical protein PI93_019950 [Pandoraea fibrosis]|uniref:Uncharacterized protein n=1 Tax=Pandoraea fibrosis TaxID=1891094 RepID=A0ABX6HVY2_9BURK|nr:hypothetical protein [Pandoraea fibrosis]QHE91763.1 hypothetical protein PJ20_008050 [Pandoraea fibrosis]QHF14679.1 hypothetical protein PI93_019950 [Pandoraea fibrosis]
MTIIIPTKGSASSNLLDVWQSHIRQQQAEKAQATANVARTAASVSAPDASPAAKSSDSVNSSNAANAANASDSSGSDASTSNETGSRRIDTHMVDLVRAARDGAKQTGKAVSGGDGAVGGDAIVNETIRKLKAMLAKVMAQLDAVRNNDRLPPEDKLQQTTALSAQAMSIQAQILALMDPTKAKGTNVDTTA